MTITTKAKRSSKPKANALPAKAPQLAKTKPVSGEISFRPGTKRRAAYDALIRPEGVTLEQGVEFLGWNRNVVGSEFREIATLTKRKLTRDGDVYRLLALVASVAVVLAVKGAPLAT